MRRSLARSSDVYRWGSNCLSEFRAAARPTPGREAGDVERALGRAAASRVAPAAHLPDLVLEPARRRRVRALREAVQALAAADSVLRALEGGAGDGPAEAALLRELAGRRCSPEARAVLERLDGLLVRESGGGKGKKKDGAPRPAPPRSAAAAAAIVATP